MTKIRTILLICIYYCRIALSSGSCNFHGMSYEDGEIWNSTCHVCQCHANSISCTKIACPLIDCNSNEIPSHHDNCCPPCNTFKKACNDGENSYVHNDVWFTTSECILNQCQDGIVVPHIIQCPATLCPKGEKLEVIPGECCPKCVSLACFKDETDDVSSECPILKTNDFEDCSQTHGLTENLAVVNRDSCTLCIYDGSIEKCFKQKCPPCSLAVTTFQNNSCCSCSHDFNSCAKDCESCSSSNQNYCHECSDTEKVLHEGRCLDKCPVGFYTDENLKCKNCSLSCKTCFGNMTSQCTSCHSGHFLQKGRCVKNCAANYYASGNFCFECHENCLSCHGPNSNDCISCSLPGQLLQDGSCVDNCTGHHYVSDGYCLECNASCARCLKDGTCQFCVEDYFLEEGYCETECTPGYYVFLDAYCLSCHEECQSCFGPLPFQCTSCPFGQFLLENSCVWDCGQGYFGDLGAGICRTCHEDCRACLGGASEDKCLTCSSGYLLPYVGTHFGTCVEKCPDGYYLTANGICEVCHSTCESCFGANETDCLTCKAGSQFDKDGSCVSNCSNGYFQEHGQCYACHPSCATCYGFSNDECYSCPHGRTLKFDKCISDCGESKFRDLDTYCQDCDPSCQDCLLNTTGEGVQCIQCKYPQLSIMYGQCNAGCPPNFYLNSNNICTECHSSCATCERSGATACVTCWNGNVLTHLGTCESQCHRGYFAVAGVCQACDADCHHCISGTECLQCKGDLVLQSGGCIQKCPEHHYIEGISRKCKECFKECSTCRGPNPGDCTSCIVGKLFQDGNCIENCSEGFFQIQDNCEPCNLKCKTCSSVNVCTSCEVPLMLSHGECVDDCGNGQYADFETLQCEACTDACAYCLSPDHCGMCYEGFYLFENTCVLSCPEHHYSDPVSRTCTRNFGAPFLDINRNLIIRVGSYILLSTTLLNVSDAESDRLFILVSSVPQNSFFVKMSDLGDEIMMKPGDNFTSTQLEDGWVFLKQSNGSAFEGSLSLKISDGQLSSEERILPLQVTSVFPPEIYQIGYIVIPEESSITINSSFISLEDKDNIGDVSLNIIQGSCHGKLVNISNKKEVSKITYQQFLQNQLVYNSSKTGGVFEDSFVIQVFDGFNAAITDFKVIIIPKDKKGVILVRNKPFYIKNNASAILTNDVLLAVGENIKPNDIIYEIDRSKNPDIGKVFKYTNDLSSSFEIKEEKAIFSQEDIDKGLVSLGYLNTNSSNVIKVKVSDKQSQFESEFDLEVHPIKSEYDSPLQEVQYGMMVLQNHAATITNDHLSFQVNGVSPNDMVYMITKKLLKEEGVLENLNKPGIRLQSFTQNDINNLKIIYHPPSYGAASDKQFMFQFVVIDAKSGSQLSPLQNFTITLTPPNSDFTSPASAIDYESNFLLGQGESIKLEHHWLSTIGHQLAEDQMEVVLTNAPLHGRLVQKSGGVETELAEEDGYSFSSIIQDMFYDHDGSTNLHDSAVFSIMSGRHSTLNRVTFEITPNDRESPVILDSTTLMGSMTEGKILILQRHHLAFTDLISGDSEIVFTLLHPPKHGKLEKQLLSNYKQLKPTDQFTQQDINENKIRYVANTGIGDDTVREFLYFDVSDASGNVQSKQVLTIKVRPQIKEPPILKVIKDILVNEGGEAVIDPNILTVFDPDTPLSDLKIVIDKQPEHGFIENSRPIPGAENTLAGIPISSFPYIDLIEGYVKYMQSGHQGIEPDKDTMYIHVQDGRLTSTSLLVNITIRSTNDEIPHVYTDILSVLSRGYAKLSNSTLSIVDADTKTDQLILTLDIPPRHGVIKKLKQKSRNLKKSKTIALQDSFTFQDVLDGLILYLHEDFKSLQNDTFSLIVSDGEHTDYASIVVNVVLSDREVPYLVHNLGLELTPGNSSIIDNTTLRASDADSPDELLVYIVTSDPTAGQLLLLDNGHFQVLYTDGNKLPSFSQKDINQRHLKYQHTMEDDIGMHYFKFNVQDPANNTLLDQTYFITVSEDIFPPIITRNTGLKVPEKGKGCINSDMLAAVDEHKKSPNLIVSVTVPPSYGHLEFINKKNTPISHFLVSDVEAGKVCYVHTSSYVPLDSFTFTITDGSNSVLQAFYINITSELAGVPVVKINPLVVKEGSKKALSEFEIDISDEDTQDKNILIKITLTPTHGVIKNKEGELQNEFSLFDVKSDLLYYWHDNSETTSDSFSIKITDGSIKDLIFLSSQNTTTSSSVEVPIKIVPVDDVSPLLRKNNPLYLVRQDEKGLTITITNETLLATDLDTTDEKIAFKVTLQPKFGFLQLSTKRGEKIFQFTQKDINEGKLEYILSKDDQVSTEDKFMFLIEDANQNRVPNQVFEIEWNRVSFTTSAYNASETEELLKLPIVLLGKREKFSEVICDAYDLSGMKNKNDFIVPFMNRAYFEPLSTLKECVFKLNDNSEFEGLKQFKISLKAPFLFGLYHEATVNIFDEEDEPGISFNQALYRVSESGKTFHFPVIRKGDTKQELSFMCETNGVTAKGSSDHGLETGSDFRSRLNNYDGFITFPSGSNETFCSIEIIDDNLYEEEEIFQIKLSNPHPFGKLSGNKTATVVIDGPNDVPEVFFSKQVPQIYLGQSNVSASVSRNGVDLSQNCTVMCGLSWSAGEENMTTFSKIQFGSFEKTIDFEFAFDAFESLSSSGSIRMFLSSPRGCILKDIFSFNVPLKKEIIKPSVEFNSNNLTVNENSMVLSIPILRSGDLINNSSVFCITHDETALSRKDFEERYITRKTSLITFTPDQKEAACVVNIYDDEIYEGTERFKVELASSPRDTNTLIGKNRILTIEITDPEDATIIQLQKSEYMVDEQIFPKNITTSVTLPVLRYGDTKLISKVRVSTIDGSAASGLDYYGKSKLLKFFPGERQKNFEVDILYNKRRSWARTFTVILGPDEIMNANVGNVSKAVVKIASVQSTESLILPAVPIVVSLRYYDNVSKGLMENPKPGYPLICVTPCDENYPDYEATSSLCKDSAINSSSIKYSWEIAMPLGRDRISAFEVVSQSTLFSSAQHKVLDSLYFRPQEHVRCVVQPKDSKGLMGIPLRSRSIKISSEIGFCHSSIQKPFPPPSLQSQPFVASLEYINSTDLLHPNKLHIHIEIPHEDGLIPIISTYPLHNIEFLLTQKIYRQQHVCSNIQLRSSSKRKENFLKSFNPNTSDIITAFPFNGEQCEKETHLLYQHLDLRKCTWAFDAWYSMSELVELCGGSVTSDFKTRDTDQTYLTVLLPLYVTYVFAAAPTGWTSVEHRTEMEFSFFYDTFLWKSGSHFDSSIKATLAVVRVGTNPDGHMFFEFKTVAKFYGCFVLDHHTLPSVKSYVTAPSNINVKFNLELLWSEQTFDGPMQFWKATSTYNLKDYSGLYELHLVPCKVTTSEHLTALNRQKYLPCIAQMPEKFELPLSFQQTNRPSPVTFALETFFQLFNDKNIFLANPFDNSPTIQYIEYKGPFSKGDKTYGRVFWSPKQGLETAYKLSINEIILCAGKNGYIPTYDPSGLIYGKGPQYGCLLPNKNLKYKFILLDKHNPDHVSKGIGGVSFDAKFVDDVPEFMSLSETPGVDGFVFNIEPLYQISSSQQWFVQIIYNIKPNQRSRVHRSVEGLNPIIENERNDSNIKAIFLENSELDTPRMLNSGTEKDKVSHFFDYLLYIISGLLVVLCIYIIRSKRNFNKIISQSKTKSYSVSGLYEALPYQSSTNSKVCKIRCKQKVKHKQSYQIKVHTSKNDIKPVGWRPTETEV